MSDAARTYTRDRLAVLGRTGGLAEPDRLWRNMLSSQPLAFSIAGELRAHPAAAVAMLRRAHRLAGDGAGRAWGRRTTTTGSDGIEAEWSPPRERPHRRPLRLRSRRRCCAWTTARGRCVSVEVKYVDSFSPARLSNPSATPITSQRAGIGDGRGVGDRRCRREPVPAFGAAHRVGETTPVMRGETGLDRALSVVLARDDDPRRGQPPFGCSRSSVPRRSGRRAGPTPTCSRQLAIMASLLNGPGRCGAATCSPPR